MSILDKIKNLMNKTEVIDPATVTPYLLIGEEVGLKNLVDKFYFYMDTLPEAKRCRDLHKESLAGANKKLFMFLSGWMGGPNLYIEAFGHPRMRMRHFPFKITTIERDEWMLCMTKAMDDMKYHPELRAYLDDAFSRFAEHMRNH